jgi:gamma-glutamylcyclotransferase (GGCT)/AIG2-like uncharacterized protein YtfP
MARASMGPLFVYGSLMHPDVLVALLDRQPATTAATAHGWGRRSLRTRPYPALVAADGEATDGLLLTDLSPVERALFDVFEGTQYTVEELVVRTTDDAQVPALAYVAGAELEALLQPQPWSLAVLETVLDDYVAGCREFRAYHLDLDGEP